MKRINPPRLDRCPGKPVFLGLLVLAILCVQALGGQTGNVKKIYSGNSLKLTDGTKIRYIGVSVPDKKDKPFFLACKEANSALVRGRQLMVMTDAVRKAEDGKLLGYVFSGDVFINAELVKQGYALALTTSPNERYKKLFRKLQADARKHGRGLWAFEDLGSEAYYIGSKKRGLFHRPLCVHARHTAFEDRVILRTRDEALQKGFSQCWRCSPLFRVREDTGTAEKASAPTRP